LIASFHGYDATVTSEFAQRSHYTHRMYARKKELLQGEARLFIAVSNFIQRKLLEQGFPSDRTVVHYIGVDTDFFLPHAQVERQPIVLFVARLTEKKGCEYLIRAMARVQKEFPDVELVIIGDGPLRTSLEKLAGTELRRYRFLGVQAPEVIRSWMNRAYVFSVPSVRADSGDSEGFGIVFAEAQAMELPVVSFASGGVPEAVSHGETGLLAPERDWQALAEFLSTLLRDDLLRHQMGKAGRARVLSHFDLKTQTSRLETLYSRVLSRQD
jgi:glycosyltransferase involved in cell wall biosynthesis